ncbi:MAG: PIN domain-containing protein [Chloroflexota bacterium]
MTIIDAAGIISFFADEPAAKQVAELLEEADSAITAVNLAETIDKLERVRSYLPAELLDAIDLLVDSGLSVLSIDHRDGREAGELRANYYNPRTCPLSLADCVALAAAMHHRAALATSDGALANVARRLSIDVVALPNSSGRVP